MPETAIPDLEIPDEPGTLPDKAETDEVGTVEVEGEKFFVVVVASEELPRDAKQGVDALGAWLDGDDPGRGWETFVSEDPERDGWRWAIISQRTGLVFYIR